MATRPGEAAGDAPAIDDVTVHEAVGDAPAIDDVIVPDVRSDVPAVRSVVPDDVTVDVVDVPDDVTVDALTRDWTIAQRRRGHRHSTDDLLTGWYAIEHAPAARRILDLGSGIGSVGLLALWRAPGAALTAVEAQAVSFALLVRNLAANGLRERVRAIHGDLRELRLAGEDFELVTGSPPYFPPTAGVVPADAQKAHARFELRGDLGDYARAARAHLAPGGRFVCCFPAAQRRRAEALCAGAGLAQVAAREVIPRAGAPALFTLFAYRRAEDPGPPAIEEPPHVVRDAAGEPTAAHRAVRASFGLVR